MKLKVIYDYIDSFAPYSTQWSRDNSGLQTGSFDDDISRVVISLDLTLGAVAFAREKGAQLIINHHPVLFNKTGFVERGTPLYEAVRNSIDVLASHTNLDFAEGGVNDTLCKVLSLGNVKTFSDGECDCLRLGELDNFMTDTEFASYVSGKLSTHCVYTPTDRKIKKVMVCSGAGGEYVSNAYDFGADAFVTGEARHHELLEGKRLGICLVSAGHYETEDPIVHVLKKNLEEKFRRLEIFEYHEKPAEYI